MRYLFLFLFTCLLLSFSLKAQNIEDSLVIQRDSANQEMVRDYMQKLKQIEQQRISDSIQRVQLELQINALKTSENLKKEDLQRQLQEITEREVNRLNEKRARIASLRNKTTGYPVAGLLDDTLFYIFTKYGAYTARERALNISAKIKDLYENDFLEIDSIMVIESDNAADIVYGETIIMSISETDALWNNLSVKTLAEDYTRIIKRDLTKARKEFSLIKILIRIGLVLMILAGLWLMIWLIGKSYKKVLLYIRRKKDSWLRDFSYKDYTFLTADQEFTIILFVAKIVRWFVILLVLYITFPLIFSIFPFTRGWADSLFNLIWSPFKSILIAIWDYLPNLITILVIYFVMRYFLKFVRYIFSEIKHEKLKLSGFHPDWAMPTFGIVRFLLYAFMFVLIFPYLPGSNSNIFKGVSVFLGILFSLGSSSAIANMVAGLVITYMRPFKIGDRIKVGGISGDVVEKNLLVTRIRTIKNEEITIPNSSILLGNTTNFSSYAKHDGLIIHTTVTIGYDIPWQKMHEALIDAALQTEFILDEPKPFVLQVSLDDFFVSYQINAYTREANKQALIYSGLHQKIQDVCNERGIEIMSPHYRAQRDGNTTTIPSEYRPSDYQSPTHNINVKKSADD